MDRMQPRRIDTYEGDQHHSHQPHPRDRDREQRERREQRFGAVDRTHGGRGGPRDRGKGPQGPQISGPGPFPGGMDPAMLDPQAQQAMMMNMMAMAGMGMPPMGVPVPGQGGPPGPPGPGGAAVPFALQEMIGSNMAMMHQMASMMSVLQKQQEVIQQQQQQTVVGGPAGGPGGRPQRGRNGAGLQAGAKPFVPGSSSHSSTPPVQPQEKQIPAPTAPSSESLCTFSIACTSPKCPYTHPSPVATLESGIVLKTETCTKGEKEDVKGGMGCEDADCEFAHVSPSVKKLCTSFFFLPSQRWNANSLCSGTSQLVYTCRRCCHDQHSCSFNDACGCEDRERRREERRRVFIDCCRRSQSFHSCLCHSGGLDNSHSSGRCCTHPNTMQIRSLLHTTKLPLLPSSRPSLLLFLPFVQTLSLPRPRTRTSAERRTLQVRDKVYTRGLFI
jgi:hypothetical protein